MPVYKDEARNTWYYSIYYKDVYGKGKRKVKRGFRTKKSARIAESEMLRTIKPTESTNKTYKEVYFERLKHANLSTRAHNHRIQQYNKYYHYDIGQIPINKITVDMCKDLRLKFAKNENLTVEYRRTVYAGFRATMSYAVKNGYIDYNPALSVDNLPAGKPRKAYITREQFDKIVLKMDDLNNYNPIMYRKFIQLLFYTGLRIGEALPLTWKDWNEDKKELDINKTIDLSTYEIKHGVAKTESSLTTVPVPTHIATILEDMKRNSDPNDVYIFGGHKPVTYHTIRTAFKKVFSEYDPDIKIHSLRHSYASHLINNGIDMYLLMNLMRHSNVRETIQTYSHLYTNSKQEAMRLFD
ncbi:tyrosine-type recombinase/integrase [Staphylococcus succinus]|uniref:site-specific integrase n=1 Tax=Staphylococcus succinus TaxID=61015 RepID=UPI00301DE28F